MKASREEFDAQIEMAIAQMEAVANDPNQLKMAAEQMKNMSETLHASSSLASGDEDGAACYLCLDGGLDEADQQVRRDCACRGTDAGFVHLSCLTNYAAAKSEQSLDMIGFAMPWHTSVDMHPSLYRSSEGSIQTIHEDRWIRLI